MSQTIICLSTIREKITPQLEELQGYIEARVQTKTDPPVDLDLGDENNNLTQAIVLFGHLTGMEASLRCPKPREDDAPARPFDVTLSDDDAGHGV